MSGDELFSREELMGVFTSRTKEVGDALREGNKAHKRLEDWQEMQLAHFMGILAISIRDLHRASDENMVSTLAWIVRNLLELSIWIEFCVRSDGNAKRFEDDGIRDLYGWTKAVIEMEKAGSAAEHKKLADKMKELEELAKQRGLPVLDDGYKKVRDAAKDLGREEEFGPLYKLCSKFAHPTAWVVRTASSVEADADIREMFFRDGIELAFASLSQIRHRVLLSFPEFGPQTKKKEKEEE